MADTALREWTVMFFFGGDNPLSPVIVSQLKAIKDAGFHPDVDVVVHFDPQEVGSPTRIYDVNRARKIARLQNREENPERELFEIGDGRNPFVRNLEEDTISRELRPGAGQATREVLTALQRPDVIPAPAALRNFLRLCLDSHRAKHYILILVGHGMVVGNDAFLPDDNPPSGISLGEFGRIIEQFHTDISSGSEDRRGELEMIGLHSCSMSSIEVAYQLKGRAKFMVGSEGTSFIGSWPYRHMLKKIFNTVEEAREAAERAGGDPRVDVETLVEKLYYLSLFNATDYMLAGYSHDLSLCSLAEEKFDNSGRLTQRLKTLVAELKRALESARGMELILLAHWKSQSFWAETHTDLADFCRCLRDGCGNDKALQNLRNACLQMIDVLSPHRARLDENNRERFDKVVVQSDNFGSLYQYARGLSIYFPWAPPVDNLGESTAGGSSIIGRYRGYAFTTQLGEEASWFSFLDSYFRQTRRIHRIQEDTEDGIERRESAPFRNARDSFSHSGILAALPGALSGDPRKPNPSVGAACSYPSIKNFPRELTFDGQEAPPDPAARERKVTAFAISEGALNAFR